MSDACTTASSHQPLWGRNCCRLAFGAGVACLALAILVLGWKELRDPNLWFDESGQFWLSQGQNHFSKPLSPDGSLEGFLQAGRRFNSDPGGYTLLIRAVVKTIGTTPFALRLPSWLAGCASLIVLWFFGRRAGLAPAWALLPAGLLAGDLQFLHYATEVRAYSFEVLAVLLAVLACIHLSVATQRGSFLRWGAALGVACMTSRYSAFPMAFAAFGAVALSAPISWRRVGNLAIMAAPTLIGLAAAYWLFVRFQATDKFAPPPYVVPFLLREKTTAEVAAIFRDNLLRWPGILVPASLLALGAVVVWPRARITAPWCWPVFLFIGAALSAQILASAAGLLPWKIHTRWSIGYHALYAVSGAAILGCVPVLVGSRRDRGPGPKHERLITCATIALVAGMGWWPIRQSFLFQRPRYETIATQLLELRNKRGLAACRFFVGVHAAPTVRYLFECGPLRGSADYPAAFHFEDWAEHAAKKDIPTTAFDLVVLTSNSFTDGYRARLGHADVTLIDVPPPSAILEIAPTPSATPSP